MGSYFPFDLVDDPDSFGLRRLLVPTQLGEMHVVVPSEGPPPAVMLLHGVGLDWTSWTPMLEAARQQDAERLSWVLVDLPGFGRSAPLTGPVTLDEVGAALIEILDHLGLASVHVLGHSMGGFAAMHLAARWPARVRSLVSVSGTYATIVDIVNAPYSSALRRPRAWAAYRALSLAAGDGPIVQRVRSWAARTGVLRLGLRGFVAHPMRARHSLLAALDSGNRPAAFRHAQATGIHYDYLAHWSAISAPTLSIVGARDVLVGARDTAALLSVLPGAATEVLPDSQLDPVPTVARGREVRCLSHPSLLSTPAERHLREVLLRDGCGAPPPV